jgi:5-oxoprolinase (ATP-hydrolysing)/N-methylhydantoinase A
VRSHPIRLDAPHAAAAIEAVLEELVAETSAHLRNAGVTDITVERSADMRLFGQLHEINVYLPDGAITDEVMPQIRADFATAYAARYTSVYDGVGVQLVSLRVLCRGPIPTLTLAQADLPSTGIALKATRQAYFGDGFVETPVYDRYALRVGAEIEGPAIIEEREATTIIGPGDRLTVDATGTLRIRIAIATAAAARITAETPMAEAVSLIEQDPVSLEIMWARLVTVVEEMWHTIVRTAFSLIVSEAQDFATDLLDPDGESLAHSPRAMPVFNLTVPIAVKAILKKYPPHTLRPGDVLITNDPWLCAGHLFDIAVVTPVFRDGTLVALTATVGHVGDIGGTKDSLRAREIYDEGVQIPPMKLYSEGVPDRSLITMLRNNIRNADQVMGDVQSMITANALGAQRLTEFMREYGLDDLAALAAVVQSRSEAATRAAIAAVPDGVYESEIENRPLGEVLRYRLRVHKQGETIHVEHVDAPRQLPRGGLNCTMNVTMGHSSYPLKCMLTPNVRGNAGCYAPITVTAPPGTALNANRPAAVAHRTRVSWYIGPNLNRALSVAIPDKVQAFTGMPKSFGFYGRNAQGRLASDHFFMGGGQGASMHGDGKSGLLFPTSAANTPVEMLESRMPVLVLEKTLVPDTGGAGRQRGGLGQRMRARRLEGGAEPISVGLFPEGWGIKPMGLFGGQPGGPPHAGVHGADGSFHDVGTGETVSLFDAQTMIEAQIAGGAGFGDPGERALEAIAADLEDGYITEAGALRDYGRLPTRIPATQTGND